MIKQGYPKKQFKIKDRIIARQTEKLLGADPWKLPVPRNTYYGTKEVQFYFTTLSLNSISGEHAKRFYWKYYQLNLPD